VAEIGPRLALPLLPGLLVAGVMLTGCDAGFIRRVDLMPERGADGSLVLTEASRVKATVRVFALETGLVCTEGGGTLIIECARQPVRVRAVQAGDRVAVCFSGLGVPFEQRKFSDRMDRMQELLTRDFGPGNVRVVPGACLADGSGGDHGSP